jgi:Beta-galactosidase
MKKPLLSFALLTAASVAAFAGHIPLYDLPSSNATPVSSVYQLSYVDGISARASWKTIEGVASGTYDWSFFDGIISNAAANNKKVMLRIICEGNNAPDWLYSEQGVYTFSPADGPRIWEYWNINALNELYNLIYNFAQKYESNPTVAGISIGCDTWTSGDWGPPDSAQDVANWTDYTTYKNKTGSESIVTIIILFRSSDLLAFQC